jgi:hypothetical protein
LARSPYRMVIKIEVDVRHAASDAGVTDFHLHATRWLRSAVHRV